MKLMPTHLIDWKMWHETDAHTPDWLQNATWNWCSHLTDCKMLHETNVHTPDRLQNAAWITETDTHAPGTVIDCKCCMKLMPTHLINWKLLHHTDACTPNILKNQCCIKLTSAHWYTQKCCMKSETDTQYTHTPDVLKNAALHNARNEHTDTV